MGGSCCQNETYTPGPRGYQMTSFCQILDADKKLFEELCDATRAGVQVTAEGRPLDKCFDLLWVKPWYLQFASESRKV